MTYPFAGSHTSDEWADWSGVNHVVEADGVTLATADRLQYVSPAWLPAEPPLPFEVIDLDVDDCGDVWLLAADGRIRRYDPDRDELREIHCTWDGPPAAPRGIAVTNDTLVVAAGASGEGGGWVRGFSRRLLQTRWIAESGYADPIAVATDGNVVSVLDGGDETTPAFVATLGRDGAPDRAVSGFESAVDLAVDDAGNRYVLDAGVDEETPSVAIVARGETTIGTAVPTDEFRTPGSGDSLLAPDCLAVSLTDGIDPNDGGRAADLLVGLSDGHTGAPGIFRHRPARGDFEPVRSYSGAATRLCLRRGVDAGGNPGLYVVGGGGTEVAFLPAVQNTRINPDTGRYDGQVVGRFDAGESVEWHRITASLDSLNGGTQVRIGYHVTDDPDLVHREPGIGPVIPLTAVSGIGDTFAGRLQRGYVRGLRELIDLPPARVAALTSAEDYTVSTDRAAGWIEAAKDIVERHGGQVDLDWRSVGPPNPRDALLEDAEGRYLWVKVELVGTATTAPRVDTLRAYFPRRSYLRYLPSLYQGDAGSAEFLERFLALFESAFTDIEEEMAAATRYLDPDGIPGESIDWLAGWLALAPDDTWSTAEKRRLIAEAAALFKQRGTRAGLETLLSIYLDEPQLPPAWEWAIDRQRVAIDARVERGELTTAEGERLKAIPERELFLREQGDLSCIDDRNEELRGAYEQLVPCPQCFAVLVRTTIGEDAIREVERLVEETSPAHAVGTVVPLYPSLRLTGADGETGHNAYLGINTGLVDRDFEVGETSLGTDSSLADPEGGVQVGDANRLGTDTRIS